MAIPRVPQAFRAVDSPRRSAASDRVDPRPARPLPRSREVVIVDGTRARSACRVCRGAGSLHPRAHAPSVHQRQAPGSTIPGSRAETGPCRLEDRADLLGPTRPGNSLIGEASPAPDGPAAAEGQRVRRSRSPPGVPPVAAPAALVIGFDRPKRAQASRSRCRRRAEAGAAPTRIALRHRAPIRPHSRGVPRSARRRRRRRTSRPDPGDRWTVHRGTNGTDPWLAIIGESFAATPASAASANRHGNTGGSVGFPSRLHRGRPSWRGRGRIEHRLSRAVGGLAERLDAADSLASSAATSTPAAGLGPGSARGPPHPTARRKRRAIQRPPRRRQPVPDEGFGPVARRMAPATGRYSPSPSGPVTIEAWPPTFREPAVPCWCHGPPSADRLVRAR